MENKQTREKYIAFHMICVVTIAWACQQLFEYRWRTHSVEQFVKRFDDSSDFSDIHTSTDLRAAFTQNHK